MNRPKGWRSGSTRQLRRPRADFIKRHPTCALCRHQPEHVDHIVPLADGGPFSTRATGSCCAGTVTPPGTRRRGQSYRPKVRVDPRPACPWRARIIGGPSDHAAVRPLKAHRATLRLAASKANQRPSNTAA